MPGMAAWDGTILTEKAEIGEPHCNIDYFKASNDWLKYSRNGREFCVQPMRWKKWACNPSTVVPWNALLLESIWQYKLSNACNADETRVFYNIQLKKICNLKERAVTAVSEAKSISP